MNIHPQISWTSKSIQKSSTISVWNLYHLSKMMSFLKIKSIFKKCTNPPGKNPAPWHKSQTKIKSCQNPFTPVTQDLPKTPSIEGFGPRTSKTTLDHVVNSSFSSNFFWRGRCHPNKGVHLKASQSFMQRRHRSLWLRLLNGSPLQKSQ